MTLISNANNIAYASPAFDIDKIVGVWEGSFDRTADVIAHTGDFGSIYLYPIAHGLTRPVFTDLLFKTTGDWADGGGESLSFSDSTYIYIVSSKFAPVIGTMQYKVIATWINDYDGTNPLVPSFLSSNKQINFDSRLNYQKIYQQNVLTFGSASIQSVAHNLGRKANFRVFCESIPGEVWPAFAGGASNPYLYQSTMVECIPDITIDFLNIDLSGAARAWYKIYVDTV